MPSMKMRLAKETARLAARRKMVNCNRGRRLSSFPAPGEFAVEGRPGTEKSAGRGCEEWGGRR